ncbi:MAG: ankyrin repeat domain-containing protein [Pseudomonadota bacterium]
MHTSYYKKISTYLTLVVYLWAELVPLSTSLLASDSRSTDSAEIFSKRNRPSPRSHKGKKRKTAGTASKKQSTLKTPPARSAKRTLSRDTLASRYDSSTWDHEKRNYFPLIVEVTGVKPNCVDQVYRSLGQFKHRSELDEPVRQNLAELQQKLVQPEELIAQQLLAPKARKAFLSATVLKSKHKAFAALQELIIELQRALKQPKENYAGLYPQLRAILQPIIEHYQVFQDRLCDPSCDRAAFIRPKVIMSGEGLLDDLQQDQFQRTPRSNSLDISTALLPPHSYRMNQDMALGFLSKDRHNRLIKTNVQGSHAVTFKQGPNGGVHFKGNTTSVGLDVGMEAAMYWFSKALFGRGMAATSLITLNEVDITVPPYDSPARSAYGQACQIQESMSDSGEVIQLPLQSWQDFFAMHPEFKSEFTESHASHLIQAAHHVEGMPLNKFIEAVHQLPKAKKKKYRYQDLDPDSYSEHVVFGALLNFSDGTPGNFMVRTAEKPYAIVGIDNDMALGPDIVQVRVTVYDKDANGKVTGSHKTHKHVVETRNILYCLPLMHSVVADSVRNRLLSLTSEQLLLSWLGQIKVQEQEYQRLLHTGYDQTQRDTQANRFTHRQHSHMSQYQYAEELQLPVKLAPGMLSQLHKNYQAVQVVLVNNPKATHWDLLLAVSPIAGRYYQAMLQRYATEDNPAFSTFQHICHCTYEDLYIEYVLQDQLDKPLNHPELQTGQTLRQVLSEITTSSDVIKHRTQRIDDAVHDLLSDLDLQVYKKANSQLSQISSPRQQPVPTSSLISLTSARLLPLLDVVRHHFAGLLRISQLTHSHQRQQLGAATGNVRPIHPSWYADQLLLDVIAETGTLSRQQNNPKNNQERIAAILNFLLQDLKLDVSATNAAGQNALHIASQCGASKHILQLLIQLGVDKDHFDRSRQTVLDVAMFAGQQQTVINLIDLGIHKVSASLALKFYTQQVLSAAKSLRHAFVQLMRQNPAVDWRVCLQHMLPPTQQQRQQTSTSPTSSKKTKKTLKIRKGKPRKFSKKTNQQQKKQQLAHSLTQQVGQDGAETTVLTSSFSYRKIPEIILQQLFEVTGKFRIYSRQGNHIVANAVLHAGQDNNIKEHCLYFKVYPELPGIEEAVGWLTRELLGFGAPHTELIRLNNIPILLSQGITGKTLLEVIKTNPKQLNQLDAASISGMLLLAMLTNPEDGKPDNYIVEPHPQYPSIYRIWGIDNDHAFVPAVVKEKASGKAVAQVKTILYCLNQMWEPVHPDVRQKILNTTPQSLLHCWLRELKKINNNYTTIFTQQEQIHYLQKQECFIGVPFQPGAIAHLYEKFMQLKDILFHNENCTHLELLSKLEPRLAKRYKPALAQDILVIERFKQVDVPFYQPNKHGSYTTLTTSAQVLQSMHIPLKQDTFTLMREGQGYGPVQALKELQQIEEELSKKNLQQLALQTGNFDILKDLTLESSRAKFLQNLDFNEVTPSQQEAILTILQGKKLRELTLKNCLSLRDRHLIRQLRVEYLRKLDLRGCTRISNASIVHLGNMALALEEISLADITNLKTIGQEKRGAYLPFKHLLVLNLQGCSRLVRLDISAPRLRYLNLNECQSITDAVLDGVIEVSSELGKLKLGDCALISGREQRQQWPNYTLMDFSKTFDKQTTLEDMFNYIESRPRIRAISLRNNALGLQEIKKLLKSYSFLQFVDLRANKLSITDELELATDKKFLPETVIQWEYFPACMGNEIFNLQNLDLSEKNIKMSHIPLIFKLTNLKNLDLRSNDLNITYEIKLAMDKNFLPKTVIQWEYFPACMRNEIFNLQNLDLSEKNIKMSHIPLIFKLTNLKNLDLRSNGLNITDEIKLAMDKNFLPKTVIQWEYFPACMRNEIFNLQNLDLREKNINMSHISLIFKLTNLKSLDLRSNNLSLTDEIKLAMDKEFLPKTVVKWEFFPECINLFELTSLDLMKKNVNMFHISLIFKLTNLKSLDLRSNNLSLTDEIKLAMDKEFLPKTVVKWEFFPECINLFELTSLDLMKKNVNMFHISLIFKLTNLKSLDLRSNNLSLTDEIKLAMDKKFLPNTMIRLEYFPECMGHEFPSLQTLDLKGKKIQDEGAGYMSNFAFLTSLNVGYNNLTAVGAGHLTALSSLISLDIRGNNLTATGASHLTALSSLISLDIRGNNLTATGASHLTALSNLTSLSIGRNKLTADGTAHLTTLTGLTFLNIRENNLTATGAGHLTVFSCLRSLDVGYNKLTAIGAVPLTALSSLASLSIELNNLTAGGLGHLTSLTGLTDLSVSDNNLTADGAGHLTALSSLTSLKIGGNTSLQLMVPPI